MEEPDILAELDEFASGNHVGPRCGVGREMERLAEDDPAMLAAVRVAVASRHSHVVVSKWLASKGVSLSKHQLENHRKRECRCDQ